MSDLTRINITFPKEVYKTVKKIAPKRGLSNFLVEAAEEKIEKIEREKALKELLAAPPAFTFLKGKNASLRWTRKLRLEDEKRLKRIYGKSK